MFPLRGRRPSHLPASYPWQSIESVVNSLLSHTMKRSLLSAFLSLLGFAGLSLAGPDLPPPEKFDLFLLAGQSNMAGRGALDADSAKAHPRVLKWTADNQWAPATEPLHWDKAGAGSGLAKSFAEIVAEKNPSITVGLIPTACGGSPISTWTPGAYHEQTKSHPYDDCMARAKAAMPSGKLKAILWHQGESDCNPKSSAVYEEKLRELIARFRKDLGMPDLPVFLGQLGRFPEKPWNESMTAVDQAQQNVAKTVPHVYFISSESLLSKGDNLHFSTEAVREFGKRYAEAYFKTQP
jgi:hypothetical protein